MHGLNPVATVRQTPDYSIHEIFYTIQGEGPAAGTPAVFVRFAGCNLRCFFCDTQFEERSIWGCGQLAETIAQKCSYHGCRLIVFTGGEPLLQNVPRLVHQIYRNGYHGTFNIETAGTVYPADLGSIAHLGEVVCSPKTPQIAAGIVSVVKAWKYIIRSGETSVEDGLPIVATQVGLKDVPQKLFRPPAWHPAPIFVQPCDDNNPSDNALNQSEAVRIGLKHGYRLSLQLHKLIGVP